jgi:hypothetical protein
MEKGWEGAGWVLVRTRAAADDERQDGERDLRTLIDEVLMPTELPNVIEKLKMDHQVIRDLFDRFQQVIMLSAEQLKSR